MTGKIGQYLRENDWLMSIKQRTGIPGGACEFDLPSYHYWLHPALGGAHRAARRLDRTALPAARRLGDRPAHPARVGASRRTTAPQGMFQQMLGGKTAQMLRLRLDASMPCVPEISANKYVLNIRFLAQNGEESKARTADWDVGFELTFCNL